MKVCIAQKLYTKFIYLSLSQKNVPPQLPEISYRGMNGRGGFIIMIERKNSTTQPFLFPLPCPVTRPLLITFFTSFHVSSSRHVSFFRPREKPGP